MASPQLTPEDTLTQAFEEHSDALFRHCYFRLGNREEALDTVQDTFTKVWDYVAKGNDVDNLKALLFKTATNCIIDLCRKRKTRPQTSLEDLQEEGWDAKGDQDIEGETAVQFEYQKMIILLEQLDDDYKDILIMRYVNNMKPAEIADISGLSANVVSVRLNRGLKKLQSLLPDEQ